MENIFLRGLRGFFGAVAQIFATWIAKALIEVSKFYDRDALFN